MTAKSVLVRPQGLRPMARALTCSPCYATVKQGSCEYQLLVFWSDSASESNPRLRSERSNQ